MRRHAARRAFPGQQRQPLYLRGLRRHLPLCAAAGLAKLARRFVARRVTGRQSIAYSPYYGSKSVYPMIAKTFFCVDAHTCGNPVRLVTGGAPLLRGASMSERRQDFLARFDWIRRALMFEPRGHDMMSGGFLYPPTQADTDCGILFIETSGWPADVRPRHHRHHYHRHRGRVAHSQSARHRQDGSAGRPCHHYLQRGRRRRSNL